MRAVLRVIAWVAVGAWLIGVVSTASVWRSSGFERYAGCAVDGHKTNRRETMHEWTDTQRLEYLMVRWNQVQALPLGVTRQVIDDMMNADGAALMPPVTSE